MDHLTAQRLLTVAQRNAIFGRIRVAKQLRLIARLQIAGRDTSRERDAIAALCKSQADHEQHRDHLLEEVKRVNTVPWQENAGP